jgi:type I restriction enzyme M protein
MLAPLTRKKVDKLWDRFWSAGLTNPLVAVEQITYLLFLKRLEDVDQTRLASGKPSVYSVRLPEDGKNFNGDLCRWSYIRQESTNARHLIDIVFPWLRTLDRRLTVQEEGSELDGLNGRMSDAYFQLDPNKGQVLEDAIRLIDDLFAFVGDGSAAQDLMGDTFEYLLSEVSTAGKNGQFRTPRHIIRVMVELLAPTVGQRLIDPAAGTGGFLFSAREFMRKQLSTPENVRLEWDGAPHRLDEASTGPDEMAGLHDGRLFVGVDNDRTMARIGWMNLVLHDIDNPRLIQGDSLSKRDGKPDLAPLLRSEQYQIVLANPPFTGTIDTADLERDPLLFPSRGKKKDDAITNKSELLFLWLMLDLLDVGGRCAVIVPEGVLFSATEAHLALRRELLTEHAVEAVISLPSGVFQPYTGVKTSIVIFRKETPRTEKTGFQRLQLRSQNVWFYEVTSDGYTLDAKRTPLVGRDNDLWDLLAQFRLYKKNEGTKVSAESATYFQPAFFRERWRDTRFNDHSGEMTAAGFAFASSPELASAFDGRTWAIHELFPELPSDPSDAEATTLLRVYPFLQSLVRRRRSAAGKASGELSRLLRNAHRFFEEDGPALSLWRELVRASIEDPSEEPGADLTEEDDETAVDWLAKEVAKVDGYDVDLRSVSIDQSRPGPRKCWTVPVRAWAIDQTWVGASGVQGSHDAVGSVRPDYVEAMLPHLYKGEALTPGLLDPDCIEAKGWNLSAGQFKPFDPSSLSTGVSAKDLLAKLLQKENEILGRLTRLQTMLADDL